jgi:hypothetical protein
MMQTYGTIASSRISGSRMPLFLIVNFIEIQSDSGPAVARPMKAPIKMAKLKNLAKSQTERGYFISFILCKHTYDFARIEIWRRSEILCLS